MKRLLKESKFSRDMKLCARRGYNMPRIEEIIMMIAGDIDLPTRCRAHKLTGNYSGCWECHISPDWLLVYKVGDRNITLIRTGTHSDLF